MPLTDKPLTPLEKLLFPVAARILFVLLFIIESIGWITRRDK